MRNRKRPEAPAEERKTGKVSRRTVARFLILVTVCVLTVLIYRLLMESPIGLYAFAAFMITETVLILIYVIYNRGFSRRGVTEDMLPDTMSREEKEAFVADGKRRMKRSSWMLMPIVAILLAFLLEAMELMVWPTLAGLFGR